MNYNILHDIFYYLPHARQLEYLLAIFDGDDFKYTFENWYKKDDEKYIVFFYRVSNDNLNDDNIDTYNEIYYFDSYETAYEYMEKKYKLVANTIIDSKKKLKKFYKNITILINLFKKYI